MSDDVDLSARKTGSETDTSTGMNLAAPRTRMSPLQLILTPLTVWAGWEDCIFDCEWFEKWAVILV